MRLIPFDSRLPRSRARRLVWALLGLAFWISISELFTDRVTTAALHAGGAWEYALLLWMWVASRSAIVAVVAFLLFSAALSSKTFVEHQVGLATPRALASIRIVVCAILLASALWEHLPSTAYLPAELIQPMGIMELVRSVPGWSALERDSTGLAVFQGATAILLFLGMLGWRTRAVLPLAALAYLFLGGILREYTKFFHTGLVPLYVLFVLAMTPCADALSLDRRRRLRQQRALPDPGLPAARYGWARYACWTAVALPYFAAGMSKIRNGGAAWFMPANLKGLLLQDTLDPMQFDWRVTLRLLDLPAGLFGVLAVTAVASEVLYPAVLFSPAARRFVPPIMAALHLGIWFLQNVLFFDLILLQLVFLDWDRLASRLAAARRRGAVGTPADTALVDSATEPARSASTAAAATMWAPRLRFMTGLLLFCWLALVEQYPFTAFQMYSGAGAPDVISYLRIEATHASGATARAPIEQMLPALRDSRYRWVMRGCFDESSRRACDQLLEALMSRSRASEGADPIVRIEVQLRHWELASPPATPEDGPVTKRYRYPV